MFFSANEVRRSSLAIEKCELVEVEVGLFENAVRKKSRGAAVHAKTERAVGVVNQDSEQEEPSAGCRTRKAPAFVARISGSGMQQQAETGKAYPHGWLGTDL